MPDTVVPPWKDRQSARSVTALGSYNVTKHDTTNDPKGPFRELLVFGLGDVVFAFLDANGTEQTDTWTFTEDMSYPQSINVYIHRVNSTGTDVSADIKGLV